jgi:hypothetical protein
VSNGGFMRPNLTELVQVLLWIDSISYCDLVNDVWVQRLNIPEGEKIQVEFRLKNVSHRKISGTISGRMGLINIHPVKYTCSIAGLEQGGEISGRLWFNPLKHSFQEDLDLPLEIRLSEIVDSYAGWKFGFSRILGQSFASYKVERVIA